MLCGLGDTAPQDCEGERKVNLEARNWNGVEKSYWHLSYTVITALALLTANTEKQQQRVTKARIVLE